MQLYFLDFASITDEQLGEEAQRWLKDKKIGKARRSGDRQRAFLAGRVAAGRCLDALGHKGYIEPDSRWGFLRFHSDSNQTIYLNISHTQNVAVAAVNEWPIGIDVESFDRDASRVLKRILSEKEEARNISAISVAEKNISLPLAYWSAKESFSKALGLGIKFGMRDLQIDFSGQAPYPAHTGLPSPLKLEQAAVFFMARGNFLVSICTERGTFEDLRPHEIFNQNVR